MDPTRTGVTIDRTWNRPAALDRRTIRSSNPCGVSSARKITLRLVRQFFRVRGIDQASGADVYAGSLPEEFFSKKGMLPFATSTMREPSAWQQTTGVPKVCEAGGDDGCEVARIHKLQFACSLFRNKPAAWDPALGVQSVESMVIRPKDLATGKEYMYVWDAEMTVGCGFSGGIADLAAGLFVDPTILVTVGRVPSGTSATSCQEPSFSQTNINSST